MNYQSTSIGFILANSSLAPIVDAPPPAAPSVAVPVLSSPNKSSLVASLVESMAYAAMLERMLFEKNAAEAGVPFYLN